MNLLQVDVLRNSTLQQVPSFSKVIAEIIYFSLHLFFLFVAQTVHRLFRYFTPFRGKELV